tara:strand:- start:295 stop:561 length:267 start_codon:yes stop_codon:yes gene_type:complete
MLDASRFVLEVSAEKPEMRAKKLELMYRRKFIESTMALGLGMTLGSRLNGATLAKTTQLATEGFFTLGKEDGHWWLINPEGKPFLPWA